jgi:hypothetical protein
MVTIGEHLLAATVATPVDVWLSDHSVPAPFPLQNAGYGDISPVTIAETGVTILFEIVGGGS